LKRVFLAVAILLSFASFANAEDRITNFRSIARIQKDDSLQVAETIQFMMGEDGGKQAIYRDMPASIVPGGQADPAGYLKSNMYITCDGADVIPVVEMLPSETNARVRISFSGSAGLSVAGPHQCEISYPVRDAIRDDGLFFVVTGQWPMPIDAAQAEVVLPEKGLGIATSYAQTFPDGRMGWGYEGGPTGDNLKIAFASSEAIPVGYAMAIIATVEKGGSGTGWVMREPPPGAVYATGGLDENDPLGAIVDIADEISYLNGWNVAFMRSALAVAGSAILSLLVAGLLMAALGGLAKVRCGYWRCYLASFLSGVVSAFALMAISFGLDKLDIDLPAIMVDAGVFLVPLLASSLIVQRLEKKVRFFLALLSTLVVMLVLYAAYAILPAL